MGQALQKKDSFPIDRKLKQIIKKNFNVNEQSLDLAFCSGKWEKIVGNRKWQQLQWMNLNNCEINGSSISILTLSEWPKLKMIDLSKNNIGAMGCKYISKCQIPELQTLILCECIVNNEGIRHLSKSQFPNLKLLSLYDNFQFDFTPLQQGNWKFLSICTLKQKRSITVLGFVLFPQEKMELFKFLMETPKWRKIGDFVQLLEGRFAGKKDG